MSDDKELVERHLAGDKSAFDEIVLRHERRVWSVCLRMCGDQEDARDAAQDTFVTALRSLGSFRGEAQLSTWLHRVAVNASLDVLRKRKKQAVPSGEVPDSPSKEIGPEEEAILKDRSDTVHQALARLSDEHRAVIVLHDLQGLQYPDLAEVLNVPLGTVKSRLHRARVDLAKLLGHLKETESREPETHSGPLT